MQVDPSQQGKYVELLAETFPTLDSSVASPHPQLALVNDGATGTSSAFELISANVPSNRIHIYGGFSRVCRYLEKRSDIE